MKRALETCPGSVRMPGRDGFTLIEMTIAMTMGTVLLLALGSVFLNSSRSVDYIIRHSNAVTDLKACINKMGQELRESSPSHITVTTSHADYDTLRLQVRQGGSPTPVYGAEDKHGVFRSGWAILYTVNNGNLERRTLDSGSSVTNTSIVAQAVDKRSTDGKGFTVTRTGSLYNVMVRLRKNFQDGKEYTKQMGSTFLVKN